jgi:butyrate kinase
MQTIETILVLNPGSTSTKIALYESEKSIDGTIIQHSAAQLAEFRSIWDQFGFRLREIESWLRLKDIQPSAVVGIGGLLKPLRCGTYRVNQSMLNDAKNNLQGEHASNLGCALAFDLAQKYGCPAYVVDPVSVDEFEPVARYSGHPLIERKTLSHALNLHATARRAAADMQIPLEKTSFVIAHLGGGISIAPIHHGRIIDVNDASSDGPFSPERTGGLPLQQFITLCFSGKYSEEEIRAMVMGKGGLRAYLGTNSAKEAEERIARGDTIAAGVYDAMAYQIAKEIGAMATVLKGRIDAIVLTGGLASSRRIVAAVSERISFLGKILIYPGEDEMSAMAAGVLRVLLGQEQEQHYERGSNDKKF